MKRTIVILALVTAFVLAFTAVAQATWRGFTPVRTVNQLGGDGLTTIADPGNIVTQFPWIVTDAADRFGVVPTTAGGMNGFITFPEARREMNRNLGSTPWVVDTDGDPVQAASTAMILFYEHFGVLFNPTGTGTTDANRWNTSGGTLGQGMPAWAGFTIESRTFAGDAGNFLPGGAFAAFGHRAEYAAAIQGTAHGGYVTTTTKCVVCHSVHRATGLENPNAIGNVNNPGTSAQRNLNQAFLTSGANTCVECHVIWGSQPSRLLVEWGGPWGIYTSGGPHAADNRGCMMCHNAGIHGLTSSRFNVMNVFMLGNTRRAQNVVNNPLATGGRNLTWIISDSAHADYGRTVAITPGSADNTVTNAIAAFDAQGITVTAAQITWFCRDTQIAAEMDLWIGPDSRNNIVMNTPTAPTVPMNPDFLLRTTAQQNQTWWYDGNRAIGPVGGLPTLPNGTLLGGTNFGAARSMATAYTCGEAGCHTTGAFFLTNWGVGKDRADSIRRQTGVYDGVYTAATPDGIPLAAQNNQMSRIGTVQVTGHVMPSTRATGMDGLGGGNACGPCHGGNPAGFPTASTIPGLGDPSRRAWGCDQCHDMVGVATNSTAWPHGNRNIVVYEWTADGVQLDASRTLATVSTGPDPADAIDAIDCTIPDCPAPDQPNVAGCPGHNFVPGVPAGTTAGLTVVDGPNIARSGNLWMYAGSIARAYIPGMPTTNNPGAAGFPLGPNMNADNTAALRSGPTFQGPTSVNPAFADQSWFVMTNVGAGRYGVPSNAPITTGLEAADNHLNLRNEGTGLVDGTCLKCHVALDSASLNASGAQAADALRHAWMGQTGTALLPGPGFGSTPTNPVWNGRVPGQPGSQPTAANADAASNQSGRLFLYR